MKNILMTFALATLFAACTPVEYDTFATITGTVVNADDQSPIDGATVSLSPSGKSAYTDDNGYFQFVDLDAPQQYTIQVQKSGYKTSRKTVGLEMGESVNQIIPLEKNQ